MINTLGDVVLETAMDAGHLQLNVEELSAGIYFIRLVSKEHNVTRKLIRN
ncbi:MAG: T9SS type A sorting domain-containing protein [Bacteroidia bacterium]